MTGAVQHDHDAAHRMTEHNWTLNAEGIAERAQVIGARLEAPLCWVMARRPAMIAQVEVDHLRQRRQPREVRLEVGVVVAARSTVDKHDRGVLAHPGAVRYQCAPIDVEPQPGAVHGDVHGRRYAPWPIRTPRSRSA